MHERAGLEARLETLYGGGIDWARATGVVHVAAIGARARAVLAIGAGAPASPTDRFVLGFARARADAIVTTGAILRAEPALVHRCADEPEQDARWQRFRAERLGRRRPPELVVLTAGAELPLEHPALCQAQRTVVLTSAAGRARLTEALGSRTAAGGHPAWARSTGKLEVVALDAAPTTPVTEFLARAIAWLQDARGHETIVLESGPRSTLGLYAAGRPWIDELLLSVFEGGDFATVAGPPFPDAAALARYFACGVAGAENGRSQPLSRRRVEEPSGAWVFERYRRADPAASTTAMGKRSESPLSPSAGSSARAAGRPE